MKKVLFIASVVKKHIMAFHLPYLRWFKENGYEVHVCAKNDYETKEDCIIPFCDVYHEIPFKRFPLKISNITAYKRLKDIIYNNDFHIIHCHTPIGGTLGRLAARQVRRNGTKVIYTAHGFHFFKGAPVVNWLVYYPIEKWLSKYTDVLITINKEDYERAKGFNAKQVEYVPGVGIDLYRINTVKVDKSLKRMELNLPQDAFVILSIGETNKNKNHEIVIRALANINNPIIHYVICGQGPLENYLKKLSKKMGIEQHVHLLGFRKDVIEICKVSDIFAFPSFREGLPVSLMEAMANGLPIVCSKIRGNSDLIEDGKGGYLVETYNANGFAKNIEKLLFDSIIRSELGRFNTEKIKMYSIENILIEMERVYK